MQYLRCNWACLSRFRMYESISCFFGYIAYKIPISCVNKFWKYWAFKNPIFQYWQLWKIKFRRLWPHVLEILESVCCFFGYLSADKSSTFYTLFRYIADLSLWCTLGIPRYFFFLWIFIQLLKINFMHQLILYILDFQEPFHMIGQEHFG